MYRYLLILVLILSSCSLPQTNNNPIYSINNFNYAVKFVLAHEGGLDNNKNDPGGFTNYGISLRYLRNEKIDLNGDGLINKTDVIDLTKDEAIEIYFKKWWIKYKYNHIINTLVAAKIFDFSVNAGATQSTKLVQRALIQLGNKNIIINGKMDNSLIELINASNPMQLRRALINEELYFYKNLVKNNEELRLFLDGWINRAKS